MDKRRAINTPSLALAEANRQRDQPSAPQDLDAMERVARAATARAEPCTPEYSTMREAWERFKAMADPSVFISLLSRLKEAESALGKIDAIRNSIIGCQKVNWSEHIYPLVAALGEAGYEGAEYEEARANVGTLIERANEAEAALQAAEARIKVLEETFGRLAEELDRAALDRQAWADHPGIGGDKPKLASHLRGKRYGYSHAAQLIRAALQLGGENG